MWWHVTWNNIAANEKCLRLISFFETNLEDTSLMWCSCFGLLIMLGQFLCFIACMQGNPQNHLWCDTCWPLGCQHGSQAPTSITGGSNPWLSLPQHNAHNHSSIWLGMFHIMQLNLTNNRVFHDKEIWRISVRLSDRSEVTQHRINFVKNYPQWCLNAQPPDHQSDALQTVLGRNLLKISEVSFLLFHGILHMLGLCLFLESIEHVYF